MHKDENIIGVFGCCVTVFVLILHHAEAVRTFTEC